MKKFSLTIAALSCTVGFARSQNHNLSNSANIQENMTAIMRGSAAVGMDNRYEGLRGSPYVITRWLPATLTTRQKVEVKGVILKYDAYQQHLLMRDPQKGDSLQLDDNMIASFVLTDPTRIPMEREFRRFLEAPEPAQSREFVEVLHQGRYTLLKQYGKKLSAANYKGAYNAADQRHDELLDQPVYYLLRPNAGLVTIKPTLKGVQAAAPELAAALKARADLSKVSGKNETEVATLLRAVDPAAPE